MRVLFGFFLKDWRIHKSYRMSFLIRISHIFFTLASFFFIGELMHPHRPLALHEYGGEYFPFVLIGLAYSRYLGLCLSGLGAMLREEQLQGTLDYILTSAVGFRGLSLGILFFEFVWISAEFFLYLLLGVLVFGLDLSRMNLLSLFLVLASSLASLFGLGVLSASFVLLFKEVDLVDWVLGGAMRLFGGVWFPVAVLPYSLAFAAKINPFTYALEGMRKAVLMGSSADELGSIFLALGLFALIVWPVAVFSFSWTIRRLKMTGALSFR
jgi:ABC-2 type transport system permease protein